MTRRSLRGQSRPRLLLVANDLFHPVGHRVQHLLPHLRRRFSVSAVSLSPPLAGVTRRNAALWWGWAAAGGQALVAARGEAFALSRIPLPGAAGPIANYLLLRRLLRTRPGGPFDVCLASGPVPGLACLRSFRCPVVYEDLDCYGMYGRDPARRAVVTFIESQCLRRAAAVITVGSVLAARARRYRTDGIHVIPNGVDFDRFASAREARDEGLVVVHGSLERWIGLEEALSALALLKRKGVRVRMKIAGTGPALGLFQGRAATLGLGDVAEFLGPIEYGEVSRLLARASLGLLCFPDTPFMRCAATLKLIECMAAGLPVVATDVGETANVVRATGAGVVVGHSPDEIAEGILSLLMGPGLRRRMGRRGRRAAEKLDWGKLAGDESSVLLDAMKTGEPRLPTGPPPRLMARA